MTNPAVGLIFLVPGFDETLRINGRAEVTYDPEILNLMEVQDRPPRVAIVVHVIEAYLHCAKAFRRSKLWDPEARQDRSALPSLGRILSDQIEELSNREADLKEIDTRIEDSYKNTLY